MGAVRTRYELRVGALVSKAALASFRIPLTPIAVPRNTVYRFRVPADRDLSDVLGRLIERDVQIVEIRRCPEPRRWDRGAEQVPAEPPQAEAAEPADGVVVPFRRARRRRDSSAG